MPKLETCEALLQALNDAAKREPSAAEMRSQRVSFIVGSLRDDSTVTRDQVRELLEKQEGFQEPTA